MQALLQTPDRVWFGKLVSLLTAATSVGHLSLEHNDSGDGTGVRLGSAIRTFHHQLEVSTA